MLDEIYVAFDDSAEARWSLAYAACLARRTCARITLVSVVGPVDESPDHRDELRVELLGLREDARLRGQLTGACATLLPDVPTDVRVLHGSTAAQLLEVLHQSRPALLVAGARRSGASWRALAPRLRDALLARAPCPVVLVGSQPPPEPDLAIVALHRGDRRRDPAVALAVEMGRELEACVVARPAPRCRDARSVRSAIAAPPARQPLCAVVAGERWPGVRRRLGTSMAGVLLDAGVCPVLVVPPCVSQLARKRGPKVSGERRPASLPWRPHIS